MQPFLSVQLGTVKYIHLSTNVILIEGVTLYLSTTVCLVEPQPFHPDDGLVWFVFLKINKSPGPGVSDKHVHNYTTIQIFQAMKHPRNIFNIQGKYLIGE